MKNIFSHLPFLRFLKNSTLFLPPFLGPHVSVQPQRPRMSAAYLAGAAPPRRGSGHFPLPGPAGASTNCIPSSARLPHNSWQLRCVRRHKGGFVSLKLPQQSRLPPHSHEYFCWCDQSHTWLLNMTEDTSSSSDEVRNGKKNTRDKDWVINHRWNQNGD